MNVGKQRPRKRAYRLSSFKEGGILPTGRPFSQYVETLGLEPIKLRGKTVIDVASGYSNFAKECHRRGINAYAVDIADVMLALTNKETGRFRKDSTGHSIAVAGEAAALPFATASADLVVSHYGIRHAKNLHNLKICIKESLRILKRDGKVRFNPPHWVWRNDEEIQRTGKFLKEELADWLLKNGFKIETHWPSYLVIKNTGNLKKLNVEAN